MEQLITTPEEMQHIGRQLATVHQRIMLYGNLAAGKTTFTKGFASTLGINPDSINSPTYTYVQIYDEKLLHIDMWRVEHMEHAHELGLREMINTYEYIVIERPKFTEKRATNEWLAVSITKQSDENRLVSYKPYTTATTLVQ